MIAHRAAVPNEIDLYIPKRKRIAHANVRWRHGDNLGLALSEVRRHTGGRPPPLRPRISRAAASPDMEELKGLRS